MLNEWILVFFKVIYNISVGHTIPQGADIYINLLALHTEPNAWPNPNNYDPDNFISTDGSITKSPNFFTFGAGRRACLGENLAKNDLFLIAAGLIQKLQFLPVPGVNYSDSQSDLAELFAIPPSYEVYVKLRDF